MSITYFHNKIRDVASEIGRLNIPAIFLEAARVKTEDEMEEFKSQFIAENPSELWEKMETLFAEYQDKNRPNIFGNFYENPEDEKLEPDQVGLKYDPEEINPLNLLFVLVFAEGKMRDDELFVDYEVFRTHLSDYGHQKLSNFLSAYYIGSMGALVEVVNSD